MCSTDTFPSIACSLRVLSSREIAPSVFELVIGRQGTDFAFRDPVPGIPPDAFGAPEIPAPMAGQFFMLRSRPSGVLLGRPVSVYLSDADTITFLVLKKGKGTTELCGLREGDFLDIVGPVGNRFLTPAELVDQGLLPLVSGIRPRVAIIGGGIGIAPVAGFALGLPPRSFDFYASFRAAPFGLDRLESHAQTLVITTEDGSAGVMGMLPAVFDASRYDLVYACGPTPMLKYVQQAARDAGNGENERGGETGPLTFLSLEQRMACGAGACLGCTVRTVNGNRRCCVDGPVFNAAEVLL